MRLKLKNYIFGFSLCGGGPLGAVLLCSVCSLFRFLLLLRFFLSRCVSSFIGGQSPLHQLHTNLVCAGFNYKAIALHIHNSTNDTTDGCDLIAVLHSRTQLLSFLLTLILRTNQHEVEQSHHNQQHRQHANQTACRIRLGRSFF